jgi:hypothetical protein
MTITDHRSGHGMFDLQGTTARSVPTSPGASNDPQTMAQAPQGISTSGSHRWVDNQPPAAAGPSSPGARKGPQTMAYAPQGIPTSGSHGACDNQTGAAAGSSSPGVRTGPLPINAALQGIPTSGSHYKCDNQGLPAAGSISPPHTPTDSQQRRGRGPILRDGLLNVLADAVDRLEGQRIAFENQYRQLTRSELDSDGELRGLGFTPETPGVDSVLLMVQALKELEHQAVLALQRRMRRHPLGPWVKNTIGIGEKQGARLLAAVGDPYWNELYDRPRLVSELWAYCGMHVVNGAAPHHSKGWKSNWNDTARMRIHLVAESCMKATASPYRTTYDLGREKYSDAVHPAVCTRCGPKGKPAQVGSPLSLGHQHARALRLVGKDVLRDLWLAARERH